MTYFIDKHEWNHTKNKQTIKGLDEIRCINCVLAIEKAIPEAAILT